MRIVYDRAKRAQTLADRGLDFEDAALVFAGIEFTVQDTRRDYDEVRFITRGMLGPLVVVVVWTQRTIEGESARRIISMRRANEKEATSYQERLGAGRHHPRGAR